MKIKGGVLKKIFSGSGNIKAVTIAKSADIKYQIDNEDQKKLIKNEISFSSRKPIEINMISENDFEIEIYHNGKKKRFYA